MHSHSSLRSFFRLWKPQYHKLSPLLQLRRVWSRVSHFISICLVFVLCVRWLCLFRSPLFLSNFCSFLAFHFLSSLFSSSFEAPKRGSSGGDSFVPSSFSLFMFYAHHFIMLALVMLLLLLLLCLLSNSTNFRWCWWWLDGAVRSVSVAERQPEQEAVWKRGEPD